MNAKKIPADDPRLTAYALGELTGDELFAVEAALREDPDARAAVAEIRATASQLEEALATEPLPSVRAEPSVAVAAILPGRDASKLDGGGALKPIGEVLRFPRMYLVVGGLAAACFALMVALRQSPKAPPQVEREVTAARVAKKAGADASISAAAVEKKETGSPLVAPTAGGNSLATASSLDQVKSTDVVKASNGPDTTGMEVQPKPAVQVAENRAVSNSTAPQNPAPASNVVTRARDGAAGAGATYVYPPDEKILKPAPVLPNDRSVAQAPVVDDRSVVTAVPAQPAKVAVVTSNSAPPFSQKSGSLMPASRALKDSAATPGTVTLSGNRTTASDSSTLDHTPVGEKFTPTIDLDKVKPRYAAAPVGGDDFVSVALQPVANFAIDTDTSGYSDVRRFLQARQRPPRTDVHIEEMLNFFPFRYAPPNGDLPFAASMEVADAPWMPAHRLVRIGLKAREIHAASRPPTTVMFVIDVSDVVRMSSRLPMIKDAIVSLLGKLQPNDRVGIVSCRDQSSLVLAPTPVSSSREIVAALERVTPGGMTSRMKGIQRAYLAIESKAIAGDASHVILCTDGNAEITITAEGQFAHFLDDRKRSGVAFTAFAFGMGIYHDSLVDFVADYNAGNWAYIDSTRDADKVLAEDVNGPSVTIAKSVTVDVAFNPAKVARYRLIGYGNRELKRDDFNGDLFDIDEVAAGHAATALFEIVPVDAHEDMTKTGVAATPPDPNELLTMHVHYKKPGGALKRKLDFPLFDSRTRFVDASADFKFAAAVAGLGMILRDSPHKGATTLTQVIEWAEAAAGSDDPGGYRTEFVELAREAEKIER